MSTTPVRIGYIGAGRWSRNVILPSLAKIDGVQLVAVANSSEESGSAIARDFGFSRIEADWRAVVAANDVDAIVVGTRTEQHYEMLGPILEAGKHVLTMNALTRTAAEAAEVTAKAASHPELVSLVYPAATPAFFLNEHRMMRSLLEGGFVGQVLQVMDHWYAPFFGLGSMFEVGQRWFGDHTRVLGYRKSYNVDGAVVAQREGRQSRPEANMALAELASGAAISYIHSSVGGAAALGRIEVYGTDGAITLYAPGQARTGFWGAKTGATEFTPIDITPELADGINVEAEFIAAVRGEHPASDAIPRFIDGLKLLEFADCWRQSSQTGAWVDVPQH